jgi:hypothetical protein
MDPHSDKSPGLSLPKPPAEQGAGVFSGQETYRGTEAYPAPAEMAPPPMPPIAASITTPLSPVQDTSQPVGQPAPTTSVQTTPIPKTEDESDALDEEWINKAKAIVERTRNDPFIESNELSRAKADYLKIRYNKQLKVAEDHH